MKRIYCKFADGMHATKKILEERYEVVECDTPQFAFFSGGDYSECYKYDCIRVMEMGENQRVNFNLFDYGYGFDRMTFGDRYLYYPLYANEIYKADMDLALCKHKQDDMYFLKKKKFCNMVVSNVRNASDYRRFFFEKLCEYKKVDSGGRSLNNLPDGQPIKDKRGFQEEYRFSLAFENSRYPGYTTEKIIQAWAAGTIPIYWGDPTIAEQFNERAFVNCNNYDSVEEIIEAIKQIDEDEQLYLEMQRQPICMSGSDTYLVLQPQYYRKWLYHIIEQGPERAARRMNSKDGWGAYAERDAKLLDDVTNSKLIRNAYRIKKMTDRIFSRKSAK